AENFPRHHRVQLLQRIARLAQPNTTLNKVPEPSLPHIIASAQNQRSGLNQNWPIWGGSSKRPAG
ncbi:hypothetical protein, partial [Mesorhizobium sp.]|uniref:hypothetical protein n=1 Tax=Mesorhizobium sp. TaxID=1871066 RepID=UPI0025EE9ECD